MQNLIDSVIKELEQKNFFEAIKYCNQLIAQFPKNHVFYEIRGNCYLETGSFVAAIQNYTDAIEYLVPKDSKSRINIASVYNRRGYARLKLNLFNEAIGDFEKAIEFKHDFAEAYNNCGNAYRKLEKYDDALAMCNRAIEYKEDFAEAYNNRGNIFYLFSKDNEAIRDYTKAISLNPNYTGAYYNRGIAYYYLQNKLAEARSDWQKVIKLNPSYEKELNEKIEKINVALEPIEGRDVSESMSLVSEDESRTDLTETVLQEEHEHKEETEAEPVLEIFDKDKVEETKPDETELTEETKSEIPEPKEKKEEAAGEEKKEDILTNEKNELSEPEEKVKEKIEDIEIPEIDFKSMFREEDKELEISDDIKPLTEIFELIYQPKPEKENIIPEEVKQLHNEIESGTGPEEKKEEIQPVKEEIQQERKPREIILPDEPSHKNKISETGKIIKPEYREEEEEKRSLMKSPLFVIPIVFIVIIIISAGAYFVYNKYVGKRIQTTRQEVTADKNDTTKKSANIDSTQVRDTSISEENKKNIKETDKKTEKIVRSDVTMVKNFVVINDKDGIYLQVASLKEKSSADSKAASINKKGVSAKVIEADLGEKGKYYRVRIGPFKNIEEAKTAANKIE
jgi:Flp pilus assembly protein TadD/cell division protein FtsN